MLNYTKREKTLLVCLLIMFVILLYIILFKSNIHFRKYNYQFYHDYNTIDTAKLEERKLKEEIRKAKEKKEEPIRLASIYEKVRVKDEEKELEKAEARKESLRTDINIYQTNSWRIKIPSLGIDAPIAEGTSQEALRRTVGHFEQSSIWDGNVALAGHNRGYRCNFFQEIKKLEDGDIIIYSTAQGERKYKVVLNKIIRDTNWTYVSPTEDNRITLITCEENKKEYRRCIQGIEIKN